MRRAGKNSVKNQAATRQAPLRPVSRTGTLIMCANRSRTGKILVGGGMRGIRTACRTGGYDG
jgi:hypothetical protein